MVGRFALARCVSSSRNSSALGKFVGVVSIASGVLREKHARKVMDISRDFRDAFGGGRLSSRDCQGMRIEWRV
jgi:hypothetical protein